MIKLVVVGAAGKMGAAILRLAEQDKDFQIIGRMESLEKQNAEFKGDSSLIKEANVVINFATPEGTAAGWFDAMKKYDTPWVIGTTGFNEHQENTIREVAKRVPIVKSSNMSMGVNVFFKVAEQIAKALPHYNVLIDEAHHIHKKDAPSGTALQAGQIIEKASGQPVHYGESKREGEIIGDHRITFSSPDDRIEIFHHAETRDIFALGALRAAKWLAVQKRPAALYVMQDVLDLK